MKNNKKNYKNNGSIILAVVFLLLIFFAGSGLLTFTITNTRISGARARKIRHIAPMHQDLIYYLHHFREKVFSNRFRDYAVPEIEYFNNEIFQSQLMPGGSLVKPEFKYVESLNASLKKIRVTSVIDLTDGSNLFKNNFQLHAETTIDILSGQIPLDYIPFFIQAKLNSSEEEFLRQHKIINQSTGQMLTGEFPVQLDFKGWLGDSINIPDSTLLFWRNIRNKLELEPGDNPIDKGIYLMMENGFLTAVFIQGDVQQLTFFVIPGTAGSIQGIRFLINSQSFEIRYKSGESFFECWDPDVPNDIVFREQIIVNGNVGSIRQEGEAAFSGYSNIILYVAGKSFIDSELETESYHLNLEKVKVTHLTLSNGMEQLYGIGYGLTEHGVTVNQGEETNLDVTIITEGKFTNRSKKLKLEGSLFCKDIENKGEIHINHKRSARPDNNYFRGENLKLIQQFLIAAIEEVSNE